MPAQATAVVEEVKRGEVKEVKKPSSPDAVILTQAQVEKLSFFQTQIKEHQADAKTITEESQKAGIPKKALDKAVLGVIREIIRDSHLEKTGPYDFNLVIEPGLKDIGAGFNVSEETVVDNMVTVFAEKIGEAMRLNDQGYKYRETQSLIKYAKDYVGEEGIKKIGEIVYNKDFRGYVQHRLDSDFSRYLPLPVDYKEKQAEYVIEEMLEIIREGTVFKDSYRGSSQESVIWSKRQQLDGLITFAIGENHVFPQAEEIADILLEKKEMNLLFKFLSHYVVPDKFFEKDSRAQVEEFIKNKDEIDLQKVRKAFKMTDADFYSAVIQREIFNLIKRDIDIVDAQQYGGRRSFYGAKDYKFNFGKYKIPEEFFSSEEFRHAFEKGFVDLINFRNVGKALTDTIKSLPLSKDILNSPLVIDAFKKRIINESRNIGDKVPHGLISRLSFFKQNLLLDWEQLNSPEVITAIDRIANATNYIQGLFELTESFNVSGNLLSSKIAHLGSSTIRELVSQSGELAVKQIFEYMDHFKKWKLEEETSEKLQTWIRHEVSKHSESFILNKKIDVKTLEKLWDESGIDETERNNLLKKTVENKLNQRDYDIADETVSRFGISKEILKECVEFSLRGLMIATSASELNQFKERYSVSDQIFSGLANEILVNFINAGPGWIKNATELYGRIGKYIKNPVFEKAYEVFGSYLDKDSYNLVLRILSGELIEELKPCGIKNSGEAGINELRRFVRQFITDITTKELYPSDITTPLTLNFLKTAVGFKSSSWGGRNDKDFTGTIKDYELYQKNDRIEPLEQEYITSKEVRISSLDKKAQDEFKYSEQFVAKYEIVRKSLLNAYDLLNEKKPLSGLAVVIKEKIEIVVKAQKEKAEVLENPIAKENIEKKIKELSSVDPRSIANFQENFRILSEYREFQEELRQLVFYMALKRNPTYKESMLAVFKESPEFKDVSTILDFVEHIVNQETMANYFTDLNSVKAFKNIINLRSFEEELVRAQDQAKIGTMPLKFFPTRGLLMEFSGQIADACWASRYDSIAATFPNITSVIFVQNPDNKNIRLAGASMLIEGQAEDGTPLLIIRGLNPVENLINHISVEEFFSEFTKYAGEIAKKMGRKLAVVVANQSGSATTNRPVLFNYIKKYFSGGKRIRLDDSYEFNGFDIQSMCYLVE